MSSALGIAVSGLNAASTRLDVAASNIANSETTGPLPTTATPLSTFNTPTTTNNANANTTTSTTNTPSAYIPLVFNQVDTTTGSGQPSGTSGTITQVNPSFVPSFDPNSPFANQEGLVAAPNVDPVQQIVQLAIAKYSFAANAKVAQTANDITKSLLDILS
jgi:flagellar basal-body rod protein FlgC